MGKIERKRRKGRPKVRKDLIKLINEIEGINVEYKSIDKALLYCITLKANNRKLIIPSNALIPNNMSWFEKRYSCFCSNLRRRGASDFEANILGEFPRCEIDLRNNGNIINKYIMENIAFFNLNPNYIERGENKTGYTDEFKDIVVSYRATSKFSCEAVSKLSGISSSEVSKICNNAKSLFTVCGGASYVKGSRVLKEVNTGVNAPLIVNEQETKKANNTSNKIYKVINNEIEEYNIIGIRTSIIYTLDKPLDDFTAVSKEIIDDRKDLFLNKDEAEASITINKQIAEIKELKSKYPEELLVKVLLGGNKDNEE